MNASLNNNLESRYYLWFDFIRIFKVMVCTFAVLWITNIIILVANPTASTKSTPCFTDGDCPSALEKCAYGSWKGLGNCRRKASESRNDLGRLVRSETRNIFKNRRLLRRKRNPSSIWNDSYLSQKRWDVWLPTRQGNQVAHPYSNAVLQHQDSYQPFEEIATDLLNFRRSYVTFKGINYTINALSSMKEDSDWLIMITRDDHGAQTRKPEHTVEERRATNIYQTSQKTEDVLADAQANVASILLENSFENSRNGGHAVVNISVRYPIQYLSRREYGRRRNARLRFRRQLPMGMLELNSIDPLINQVTHVEPMIPAAEDIFSKNIGKRSAYSKEMHRARRELEEMEDDVARLPKVIRGQDDGPIMIEDLFNDKVRSSTFRKRRHHEAGIASKSIHNRATRHKRHRNTKEKIMSIINASTFSLSGRSKTRNKRKLSHSISQPSSGRRGRSSARTNDHTTVKQRARKRLFNTKITKRDDKGTGRSVRKIPAAIDTKNFKKPDGNALGGNTTKPGTTEPPDPFAKLKNAKDSHIDYYDVSKRNLLKDEEDIDSESALDEDSESPDEDESEIDNVQEQEKRRKRQTLAEELEDDDEQDIPSWRETVELLRRASTFAVPSHDSAGHVVLIRRVRDLGALDLAESLTKLKETMAKIFGRCSPARRRKRSHRAPPEVVTDQLSNEETWEIQGQDQEVVDQAKVNLHMDDDKQYNVTTVLRPMGKRSYSNHHENHESDALRRTGTGSHPEISREMRDIMEQNVRLDKIHYIKRFQPTQNKHNLNHLERISRADERSLNSKRNEENIPLNKDVHIEAQEGSPVEIDLMLDQQSGADEPVAEVQSNTLSTALSQPAVSKRNQHFQSASLIQSLSSNADRPSAHLMSRHPSLSLRGSRPSSGNRNLKGDIISNVRRRNDNNCVGCETFSQSASNTLSRNPVGRKIAREPYIITRRYNDSKMASVRTEGGSRRTRELENTSGLDRVNLLYLADGDPLPSSWRAPLASVKRDVDVEVEIEKAGNDTDSDTHKEKSTTTTATTTTTTSPPTVDAIVDKEKDEEVFSGNLSSSSGKKKSFIESSASVTSENKEVNPRRAASISLGRGVSAGLPVRANVISLPVPLPKSILTVTSGEGSPAIGENIGSSGPDWGISGSSDRLMALISGIEKALRVPLGGSDSNLDEVTVDDSSNSLQTQLISSQPEITEEKLSYLHSVNEPPSIVTNPEETRSDVVKMDITTGTGAAGMSAGKFNEHIYLKGFDVPRKPARPLFVDAVAKKMSWAEPSYKTVVSSGLPKYRLPLKYVRLYSDAVPRIRPVDKWTHMTNIQNVDAGSVEDLSIGNGKQVTIEKIAEQPSDTEITDVGHSKIVESIQLPRMLEVQKNMFNSHLVDIPPHPERDRDTIVKVVSSLRSDDPESRKTIPLNISPTLALNMDGQDNNSSIILSKKLPSNIRIIHEGSDSDGTIVATIGSQNNLKKKKDLQEFSDATVPIKHSRLLSSNGVLLTENNLNDILTDAASAKVQGEKRNSQNIYKTPTTKNKQLISERANAKNAMMATKRDDANQLHTEYLAHTYSKDPGVQGATMDMMDDLASKLASQNAKRGKTHTSTRMDTSDQHRYPKLSRLGKISSRQIKKRDISRTVFEQPKVFIVSPKTFFEAPGTKYKFIDPQGRSDVTKHQTVNTVSNISTGTASVEPVEKQTAPDRPSTEDESFGHDRASSLPKSHEKALQEAESRERFKIVDSVEGFSVESPSFDKKVTSGGQISEDRMVPVPFLVDGLKTSNDKKQISVTTNEEPREHKAVLKVSETETADSDRSPRSQQRTETVEYVNSAAASSDNRKHTAKVIEMIEDQSLPNTRKKRRSSRTGTANRRSREEKIETLRTELQKLNNIGSKLGMNFFDKSSIDRIVREVTHKGKEETSQTERLKTRRPESVNVKKKRKTKIPKCTIDTEVEKCHNTPLRTGGKRNLRRRRAKHLSGSDDRLSPLSESVSSNSMAVQNNVKYFSKVKRKQNNDIPMPRHDKRKEAYNRNQQHVPVKRKIRSSRKTLRDVESSAKNNTDILVVPIYHYQNEIKNDHQLVIPNPESHDQSNNRQREETLTVSKKVSEPMEVTALLRGRRKKRDIKPSEFFRFFREKPPSRRSKESQIISPSNPILTGQWQKQFIPARLDRNEHRRKSYGATQSMQNTRIRESNERNGDFPNVSNPMRAYLRSKQEVSELNYPQMSNITEMNRRQQLMNTFLYQRNYGSQGRQAAWEPVKITQNTEGNVIASPGRNELVSDDVTMKTINQGSLKPIRHQVSDQKQIQSEVSNTTKEESAPTPRKSKDQEIGVWKKLGDIFDIGAKEPVRSDLESTVSPVVQTSSAVPPPPLVPEEGSGRMVSATVDGEGLRRPDTPSSEDRAKSGLRAAIVDRLLQDLRKMASARGSEMARAESDLIEILHDYQTDLMDEDEQTIAGEPFQGVRIHENMVIPMVYQAVPIKMEGLSSHRLVARSSDPRPARDRAKSGHHTAPYNQP